MDFLAAHSPLLFGEDTWFGRNPHLYRIDCIPNRTISSDLDLGSPTHLAASLSDRVWPEAVIHLVIHSATADDPKADRQDRARGTHRQ